MQYCSITVASSPSTGRDPSVQSLQVNASVPAKQSGSMLLKEFRLNKRDSAAIDKRESVTRAEIGIFLLQTYRNCYFGGKTTAQTECFSNGFY